MTASPTAARPSGRRTARAWIPPQHGAWAMLALPVLVGLVIGGPAWLHLPLVLAWFTGYAASYYLMLAIRTGRHTRGVPQLGAYGVPALVCGLFVAIARPALLWVLPVVALVLGIGVLATRARSARGLVNDFAMVVLACLMVPVTVGVGPVPLERGWSVLATGPVLVGTGLVLGYLGGTVLYVKTMIRNRGEPGYLWASVLWHVGWLVLVLVLVPLIAPLYGWFAVRAWLAPSWNWRPKDVGVAEIAGTVGLVLAVWLAAPVLPGVTG